MVPNGEILSKNGSSETASVDNLLWRKCAHRKKPSTACKFALATIQKKQKTLKLRTSVLKLQDHLATTRHGIWQ